MLRSRRSQFGTLANTLLILMLVMGLLMVAAGTSIFQMRLSHHASGQDGAKALAEAAVRVMIARVINSQRPPTPVYLDHQAKLDNPTEELRLTLPSYPGGEALLTLSPARAAALDIPLSVNKIGGDDGGVGSDGTIISPGQACLVAEGRYQGCISRVEVMLHIPKFPYVVASTLPIQGQNMEIFAVSDAATLDSGFGLSEADKEPGHIATNSPDISAQESLILGTGTKVKGDAVSRGTVDATGATVTGETRNQSEEVPVPKIDIALYDPTTRPEMAGRFETFPTTGTTPTGPIKGYYVADPPPGLVYPINGALVLDAGVVFVKGDVAISGGISGNGALIATGDVTISGGGSSLSGADGAAILAGGNLDISGTSSRQSFRGLVYTEGTLTTNNVNLAGSVAVNSSAAGAAAIANSTLVESPEDGIVSIPGMVTVLPASPLDENMVTVHANLDNAGPWGFPGVDSNDYWTANAQLPSLGNYDAPPAGFVVTQTTPYLKIEAPTNRPADLINTFDCTVRVERLVNGVRDTLLGDYGDRPSALAALEGLDSGIDSVGYISYSEDQLWDVRIPEFVTKFNENARLLAEAPVVAAGTPGSYTRSGSVDLDFSRFSNTADQIRILSWREF